MNQRNIFERAFELARDGQHQSVDDIRRKLKAEKFDAVDGHMAGPTIARQLKAAMKGTAG